MSRFRPIARCRVPDLAHLRETIRLDVRRCMATLAAAGCPAIDLAYLVGVSRSTLYRWRNGDELPDPVQLATLRALAAEVSGRKAI
jgi:transcriptional regulator with XRE-family HTH domain